jgi:phosphate transport system substrate-binding protein
MKFSHPLKLLGIVILCVQGCTQNDPNNVSLVSGEIKIGGSAETYEILEELAEGYREKSQAVEFKFLPNSQTSGGIQGVQDNILDIGAVGRSLTPEEQSETIEYHALAQNALVVVTHQSVGNLTDLTTEQLQGIYRGEIKNWQEIGGDNTPIVLIDIPEDESEKQLLREHYLGEDLEITKNAILLTDEAQALEAIATTEYSIGAIPLSEEITALPVNVLSLDGIEPTSENIEEGRYKMAQTLGIVFVPNNISPVRDFIDFVLSEEGREVIEEFTDDDD